MDFSCCVIWDGFCKSSYITIDYHDVFKWLIGSDVLLNWLISSIIKHSTLELECMYIISQEMGRRWALNRREREV